MTQSKSTAQKYVSEEPKTGIKQKRNTQSLILYMLVNAAAFLTFAVLILLLAYILIKGVPNLIADFKDLFAMKYTTDNCSLVPSILNTVYMVALAMLIAVPFGIGAAIYLVEYAKRGNRLVSVIRLTTETLAGIPSIVYGLFGFLFFVSYLGWNKSLLSGAVTLSIMVLPTIIRTTEEALKAVPDSYREGSFGLGAGRVRTVFQTVLPTAVPGILAGIILAIGRAVGETAALIFTAGTSTLDLHSVMDSGRTLAVHMYMLSGEGLHTDKAYAAAVVLLLLVIGINAFSNFVAGKLAVKKD